MGAVFAEALLTGELSLQERKAWGKKLEKWQAKLDDYGVDDEFDVALCAAESGWDYPPLRRAMLGQVAAGETSDDESEAEDSWFADELTEAWLNVLERQSRTGEFLALARATGRITRYITMLVKAGQVQEAVDYGLTQALAPAEALALAKALREHGEHQTALRVAERGLDGDRLQVHDLAIWLRDAATALGDHPLALRAARTAFAASYTLADYLAVQAAADEGWAVLRAVLLDGVRGETFTWISGPIDIYLHEGLVDDAVRLVNSQPYVDYATLGRVADAAYASHPDWVIRQCRRQAEPTMDEGKSKYYSHALGWLERVKKAYVAAGRGDEWRMYCEGLIVKHGRKYSLVPGLRARCKGSPVRREGACDLRCSKSPPPSSSARRLAPARSSACERPSWRAAWRRGRRSW